MLLKITDGIFSFHSRPIFCRILLPLDPVMEITVQRCRFWCEKAVVDISSMTDFWDKER